MAEESKTKVVEFQIRGNTINLEKEIKKALNSINAVQQKLTNISTKGTVGGGLEGAVGVSTNISDLKNLTQQLNALPKKLSPDQLNMVAEATKQLNNEQVKLRRSTSTNEKEMKEMRQTLRLVKTGLDNTGKSVQTLGGRLGVMTIKLFTLRRVFDLVVRKLKEGLKSSIAYVETVNLFNVAAGKSVDTLSEFAKGFTKAFSADPNEVLKYVGTFNIMATSLNATSKQAEILSKNSMKLAYDLSSLFNVDVDSMATSIRSGLTGISKPLKKYGIVVTDTVVKQEAAMMGITKSWENMSEIDKMGLRYLTILKQASAAQGDFARTIESPENQMKIFKAQTDLLFRSLGNLAMIIGKVVLPVVNGLLIGTNKILGAFTQAAGHEVPDFTKNLMGNADALGTDKKAVDALKDSMKGVLAPFDELNVMSKAADKNKNTFGMDPQIEQMLKGYDNLMDKITSKAEVFGGIVTRAFSPETMATFGSVAKLAFDTFALGIEIALGALNVLAYPIGWLTTALAYLLKPIEGIVKGWNSADKATRGWARAGGIALGVIGSLIAAMKIYNAVSAISNGVFKDGIKFLLEYTGAMIKNTFSKIKNAIATKALAIQEWWHNASLASKVMLVSAGAAVGVVIAAGIAAAVMSSKAKQTQSAIPAMATGGVVGDSTLALIGEGKYSEAVVPLGNSPQFTAMKEEIASEVAKQAGGRGDVKVYVSIGGRDFENYTYRVVDDENKRNTGVALSELSRSYVGR